MSWVFGCRREFRLKYFSRCVGHFGVEHEIWLIYLSRCARLSGAECESDLYIWQIVGLWGARLDLYIFQAMLGFWMLSARLDLYICQTVLDITRFFAWGHTCEMNNRRSTYIWFELDKRLSNNKNLYKKLYVWTKFRKLKSNLA